MWASLSALAVAVLCAAGGERAYAAGEKIVPVVPGYPVSPLPEQRAPVPKTPESPAGYSYDKEVGGPVQRLPNGNYKMRLDDGSTTETHGPDSGLRQAGGAEVLGQPGSLYGLPPEGVQPLCPTSGTVGSMGVVYAYVRYRNNYNASAAYVASAYRRAHNSFAWNGPWSGSGANFVKWNVFCGGVGSVEVPQTGLDSQGRPTCDFDGIVNAARAVYGAWQSKYVIFADCSNGQVAGQGLLYDDTQPGSLNRNNQPTPADGPMYAIIWRDYWGAQTVLHEIGHTLGAVQNGAPRANGHFHCNDGIDVMCYSEFGEPYGEQFCPHATLPQVSGVSVPPFDCAKNTYFNAQPGIGGWLSDHWNIARSYNRFVTGGPSS